MNHQIHLRVTATKKPFVLSYTDAEFCLTLGHTTRRIPLRQVIAIRRDGRTVDLSYIGRKKNGDPMSLTKLAGIVEDTGEHLEDDVLDAWMETLLHLSYEGTGVKRGRRLKVIINPHGGTKKGAAIFDKTVEPILRAAQCTLDIIHTTRGGHAYEIAKTTSLDYDAMVIVSGDGLIHEVLNGFAHHEQPINALRIPIAPIPTGTGNGLSLNILGMADGFDVSAAALNAVKGLPMKVDVFSLTQNSKRTISFMSQGLGLIADLDIGTEHMRWMGEARFTYGFLRGLIQFKPCPIQLSYKAVEFDKDKMYDTLQKRRETGKVRDATTHESPPGPGTDGTALPPLRYSSTDEEGWTTLDKPLLYLYAGKGPYVGRDFMAFPVSLPDDGLIDIVAQEVVSLSFAIFVSLTECPSHLEVRSFSPSAGANSSVIYFQFKYIKAYAYRVKPLAPKGNFSVDGEVFPFEEFQVETHQGLATLLSPHGYYAAEFARRSKPSA
ncbi:ATP-NAD kinase-like domain-containing protein [Mycena maculata]|uniref:ATP-NAD kinase-like domain-containing protein n=1 Tax=Mycena maculata TaxID=230809 RepID=A0AAD7JYJ5_9AGAR|nr:ATP-NAD kinase-like domain-containing protein [Mycena maculata]